MDATIVNVAIPRSAPTSHARLPTPVGHRRLHPGAGLVAVAVGRDGRPLRSPAGVPDRARRSSRSVRCCAAWRPHRDADRRPIPSGHRRVDAQSRCAVDHLPGLHRPGGARSGDRFLGRGRGHLDGTGSDGRWLADRADQLAGSVLDQPADLRRRRSCSRRSSFPRPSRRPCATSTRSARRWRAFLFGMVYTLIEGPGSAGPVRVSLIIAVVAAVAFVVLPALRVPARIRSSTYASSAASRSRRRR